MLLERSDVLEAKPYERTSTRRGDANGFKSRTLYTPVGALRPDLPPIRSDIELYPTALERYSRTDKAPLVTMAKMDVQGVSTRKVDEVLLTLCGMRVSSSQVSRATAELEPQFEAWRNRPLGAQPYLLLDARFEKVRVDGSLRDCVVFAPWLLDEWPLWLCCLIAGSEGCSSITPYRSPGTKPVFWISLSTALWRV